MYRILLPIIPSYPVTNPPDFTFFNSMVYYRRKLTLLIFYKEENYEYTTHPYITKYSSLSA